MNQLFKSHVKTGDKVKIISGKQKGIIGNILTVIRKKSLVVIEGILPRVKYIKSRQGGESKKTELPIYIHLSNVMLWDSEKKISSKIGYKILNGQKKRYFKKSGNFV
jgi:large subunit ribosomal protein L24